jgi:quercetin dioxygenase-like cupin family protein
MRHIGVSSATIHSRNVLQKGIQMKTKTKVAISAGAVVSAVGLAFATPIINLASPFISSGNDDSNVEEHGVAKMSNGEYYNVTLTTDGPSTIAIQDGAYGVGGHNGWHSHPGLVAVTVTSGTIIWYDANCRATTYHAGDSWVEGSQRHAFSVVGNVGVQLTAVFITAKGEPYRIDQQPPACAAALGIK